MSDFRPKLVPELLVTDLQASLEFWVELLGFDLLYERPEEKFAYLNLDGAELMLEQRIDNGRYWITGPLENPFGRGINFQIEVKDAHYQLLSLTKAGWPLFMGLEEKWYQSGDVELGVKQFLVKDPDGYLLRLSSDVGTRPIPNMDENMDENN